MLNRSMLIAVAAAAILLAGCSNTPKVTQVSKPTSSASAAQTTSEPTESASGPLGAEECLDVAQAHLDIIVASDSASAAAPAEKLKQYDPPAAVVEAIDHFAEVGGVQFDDPDATKYTDELTKWISEVCPT